MRPTNQQHTPLLPPEPGGHLPVALLRQYVAGTLAPAAQHRVEAHTLDCQRCADVLEGLEMTEATTTDQSLNDLQSRLRARLAQAADPKPATNWPWLQMAGALLLLIASIVGWRLNQVRTETQSAPVATVLRAEKSTAQPQPETETMASPATEVAEQEPAAALAADAAAPVPTVKPPRPAAVAAISSRSKARATKRTRAAGVAASTGADIAARQTEALGDKVLADKEVDSTVAATAPEAKAPAVASAPLPPDPTRTTLARVSGSATMQAAKMPPGGQTRSFANSDTAATAGVALVRGRITDQASGAGLPGVTVQVKGSKLGVSTQADGSFALPVADTQSTLTVTSIGYQTREYKLTNPAAPFTLALAADTKALSEVVVTRKSKMPVPPAIGPAPAGGMPAFHEYLKKELEYPEKALRAHIQGTVKLKFTVSATGAIEDLKVVDSLSKECDEEAMRLVREGPAWFPGIIGGRRTAQQVRITVPFRL